MGRKILRAVGALALAVTVVSGMAALRERTCGGQEADMSAGEAKTASAREAPAVDPADVRRPAVAGKFYPGDRAELVDAIDGVLARVARREFTHPIRAVVVPHAGYVYSAPVAAYAYRQLLGNGFDRVILLGSPHFVAVEGVVLWARGAWDTPLGRVYVDEAAARAMMAASPRVRDGRRPHEPDHALEVQLPFLQKVLAPGFRIVPVLVRTEDEEDFRALTAALGAVCDARTLVVVSTDLSHYPSREDAEKVDARTLASWRKLDAAFVATEAREQLGQGTAALDCTMCGQMAVVALMKAAPTLGIRGIEILHSATSAAVSGDEKRVVGYGAAVLYGDAPAGERARDRGESGKEEESLVPPDAEQELLAVAREAVEAAAAGRTPAKRETALPILRASRGCFVTLKRDGALRGCIGRIESGDPLIDTVRMMAVAAATQDPRFPPLSPGEVGAVEIEISVLSAPTACPDWRAIDLGRHGVVLRAPAGTGVFLPQVATETGWSLEEFLGHLAQDKAGLGWEGWRERGARLFTFTVQKLRG